MSYILIINLVSNLVSTIHILQTTVNVITLTSSIEHSQLAAFSCFNEATRAAGSTSPPSQIWFSVPRLNDNSWSGFGT